MLNYSYYPYTISFVGLEKERTEHGKISKTSYEHSGRNSTEDIQYDDRLWTNSKNIPGQRMSESLIRVLIDKNTDLLTLKLRRSPKKNDNHSMGERSFFVLSLHHR